MLSIRQTVMVILALGILFASIFAVRERRSEDANAYFAAQLADARAFEAVTYGTNTYIVDGDTITSGAEEVSGRERFDILQIAYAKLLARRAPIMALPGTDMEDFHGAVDALKSVRDGVAEIQKTTRERNAVLTSLYPFAFLEAIGEAEDSRRVFLRDGSVASWRAYESSLLRAFDAYHSSIARYRNAFVSVVPDTTQRFAAGESSISFASVLDTLERMEKANADMRILAEERSRCLSGEYDVCKPLEAQLPPLPTALFTQGEYPMDAALRVVDAIERSAGREDGRYPPLYALASSGCVANSAALPLYTVDAIAAPTTGGTYERVKFVGNIPFIPALSYSLIPFYNFFNQHGVSYIPVNPLLHYVCIEFWRDMAPIHAAATVRAFALAEPLSGHVFGTAAEDARGIEHSLEDESKPIYGSEVVSYLKLLERASANLPGPYRAAIMDLEAAVTYSSIGYGDMVRGLVETESGNLRAIGKELPLNLEASYAFFFRSAMPFLLMGSNPSVTGSSTVRSTLLPPAQRTPYVYFTDIATTTAATESLIEDMTAYRNVHVQSEDTPLDEAFEPVAP